MNNLHNKFNEILLSLQSVQIEGYFSDRSVYVNGQALEPGYSQAIRNHSPDGFNWGYSGSGPAQFALALCLKFLPYEIAVGIYQNVKFNLIAGIEKNDFNITVNLSEIFSNAIKP